MSCTAGRKKDIDVIHHPVLGERIISNEWGKNKAAAS